MATAKIRGIDIHHVVFGSAGPWLALTTGGRSPWAEFESLAVRIAAVGFRVVLHDRRNTGASQMLFDGSKSEEESWADDVVALMDHLGAPCAFYGGGSSGARVAMLAGLRHPAAVRGLMLLRVTGGEFAAGRLPTLYYRQYIRAAQRGGMAAVCETEQYRQCIAARPESLRDLMSMDPAAYVAVMSHWLERFTSGPTQPMLGISESQLRAIAAPVLVVPGNDRTHPSTHSVAAAALMPGAELFRLPIEDRDDAMIPFAHWAPHESAITWAFADFMRRHAGEQAHRPPGPAVAAAVAVAVENSDPMPLDAIDSMWGATGGVYPTRVPAGLSPRPRW